MNKLLFFVILMLWLLLLPLAITICAGLRPQQNRICSVEQWYGYLGQLGSASRCLKEISYYLHVPIC